MAQYDDWIVYEWDQKDLDYFVSAPNENINKFLSGLLENLIIDQGHGHL